MELEIKKYDPKRDYNKIVEIIKREGEEWKDYLKPEYKTALEQSDTHVAYVGANPCGYVRSMDDFGLYSWVLDLLVDKKYRGNEIGKQLLEHAASLYPGQETFVMSDVDEYYEKTGYIKEGSIFKIA